MSKTNIFNAGDIVRVKTGGTMMRVHSFKSTISNELKRVADNSQITCVWYDEKHKMQFGEFSVDQLELVKEKG